MKRFIFSKKKNLKYRNNNFRLQNPVQILEDEGKSKSVVQLSSNKEARMLHKITKSFRKSTRILYIIQLEPQHLTRNS